VEYRYRYHGVEHSIRLDPRPDGGYVVQIGERTVEVEVERAASGEAVLIIDGQRIAAHIASRKTLDGVHHFVALTGRDASSVELVAASGLIRRTGSASGGSGGLEAQMPGQVMQVFVTEGDGVSEGQPLMLLEAMKMEIRVTAPQDGTVTRILVQPGETVERGQTLIEVGPQT